MGILCPQSDQRKIRRPGRLGDEASAVADYGRQDRSNNVRTGGKAVPRKSGYEYSRRIWLCGEWRSGEPLLHDPSGDMLDVSGGDSNESLRVRKRVSTESALRLRLHGLHSRYRGPCAVLQGGTHQRSRDSNRSLGRGTTALSPVQTCGAAVLPRTRMRNASPVAAPAWYHFLLSLHAF